jgi:hypothetical protein
MKGQIEEAFWDTMANESCEPSKPDDMDLFTTKVVQRLAHIYPIWKEFPSRCMARSNKIFGDMTKTFHNKFANSPKNVKTMVARLRRQRASDNDKDKEIQALKETIEASKQDVRQHNCTSDDAKDKEI